MHPHLNRVKSGRGAAYAFYRGDSCTIQRADGGQTGIDWMMPLECKREAQVTNYMTSSGKGTEHPWAPPISRSGVMSQVLNLCFILRTNSFFRTRSEDQSDLFRVTAGVPVAELKLDLIIPILESINQLNHFPFRLGLTLSNCLKLLSSCRCSWAKAGWAMK